MQNNNSNYYTKASDKQIQALRNMGYTGPTDALTVQEASEIIKSISQNKPIQAQQQNSYNNYNEPISNAPIVNTTNSLSTSYTSSSGELIEFSKDSMNSYLGLNLTTPEYQYFSAVCQSYKLNPFLKDIYAIKFGSQPATFIIDYKILQQAADNDPDYDGLEKGVLFLDKNGIPTEREGDYLLPGEKLIGAWCIVHRKSRKYSPKTYAMFDENCKYKDGKPSSNWATRPVFMIVKVAKAQALRESFPNAFSNNTYTPEELTEEDLRKSEERKNSSIEAVATEQSNLNANDTPIFEENSSSAANDDENTNDWLNK